MDFDRKLHSLRRLVEVKLQIESHELLMYLGAEGTGPIYKVGTGLKQSLDFLTFSGK